MARKKLEKVPAYIKAQARYSGMKSINANLDLDNGNTLAAYSAQIDNYQKILSDYNAALSTVDDLYNRCLQQGVALKDWNEKMLIGVANKFGKDSSQYEMAGGTRKSERKKQKPRAKKSV